MSWLTGYKQNKPSTSEEDPREAKRNKLEAERLERLSRAKQRDDRQKQLDAAIKAQEEANQALQDLLELAPDIFEETGENIADIDPNILDDEAVANMADFDVENGTDGEKAIAQLNTVQCPFDRGDIEYWFSELEMQLSLIEVKSQWLKRLALQRFLPVEIRHEVKDLLILGKTEAGTDIYKKLKTELVDLFGSKPEDAYMRAKNRVMTGLPSQLGKAVLNDR